LQNGIKGNELRILPKGTDRIIFFTYIALVCYGLVAIYSASAVKIGAELVLENYYIKQSLWFIVSLLTMIAIINLPEHIIDIFIIPGYIFSVFALIIVLFLPPINGSHRWIALGPASFQPSELAKIFTILMISKTISREYMADEKMILNGFLYTIIPVMFIIIEPDLGTSLIFFFLLFTILTFSDMQFFYVILILGPFMSILFSYYWLFFVIFIVVYIFLLNMNKVSWVITTLGVVTNTFVYFVIPVLWKGLKNYQKDRILTFIDPTRDPFGAGYQIIQSKIAIGSGNLFGKGFLEGTQKNLNFLPEHHTDFIFSVIGEEFGFFGCAFLLLLFFILLTRIAYGLDKIVMKERKLAVIGIFAFLAFQVFINIGMNLSVAPTTGITLPFISYGGSNLLVNSIAVGLILKFELPQRYR